MLAILLLTALLVIRAGPDSLLGKALRRPLVDWPAGKLALMTRGRFISLVCVGLLISAGIAIIGKEAMQIMSMAMPETLAWLATFDLSVLVDAVVAAALLGAQVRLRGTVLRLRSTRQGTGRQHRAPRARRRARPAKADNEDDPAASWALAA